MSETFSKESSRCSSRSSVRSTKYGEDFITSEDEIDKKLREIQQMEKKLKYRKLEKEEERKRMLVTSKNISAGLKRNIEAISKEEFTFFQNMVKESIAEGFKKIEERMENMEKQLADMEENILQMNSAGQAKKLRKEEKMKIELWHVEFKGKDIRLIDITFDIISELVQERRLYMRNNKLITPEIADFVEEQMSKSDIKYTGNPVIFGRKIVDLLLTKEQQMFFKMIYKSQRTSDRQPLPFHYAKKMKAIINYAGASIIHQNERHEYMLILYSGINDRSLNMNKSGKVRNVTMYFNENVKALWEEEKELKEIMEFGSGIDF
ncbi:Hypothetical protein SRAE_0000050800 [Strongyloides ratti]|uniref:Uncharacterized protein n=1 Tax=Strongyloides ratti TaxID=34506 RepID=A0A090MSU4_STRRB|nr:Hypothetical protein SRAE_0000050800 [Strongyloides ratti]CEF61383.1 Hypothetical protein SRAE_0000050800 [Strongyloides ratti]